MKVAVFASLLCAASLFASGSVAAATLAYPGPDNASFLIDHPADWAIEPGDEVGDYVTLAGPSGVVVQIRTIPGDESAIDDAIKDTVAYIKETFTDVTLGESEKIEHAGMTGFYASGAGVDSEKSAIGFSMAFFALNDGNIAEVWFAVDASDDAGAAAAGKVLDSLRTP
jgi:hypothetical protein